MKKLKFSHCGDVELRHCNQKIISLRGSISNYINEDASNCHCEEDEIRRGNPYMNKLLKINKNNSAACTVSQDHFTSFAMTNICNSFCLVREKSAAFTLAEVLITLGVIGVVAAITIPGLMAVYRKHVVSSQLRRSISVINQAIKASEAENGEMETWNKNLPDDEFISTYFSPFMNISLICKTSNTCGYDKWKNLNGRFEFYSNPFNAGRFGLLTNDGFVYFYSKSTGGAVVADNDRTIIVDINGSSKPNQFGKDVFFLYRIEEEDSIIPYGAEKPISAIKNNCSENNTGFYCAAWIRQNGWRIPKGYPKL